MSRKLDCVQKTRLAWHFINMQELAVCSVWLALIIAT